ncbi:MAG: Gfo/Idh/MocA family oxidoreductase [Bryobacteraceae bacterium]
MSDTRRHFLKTGSAGLFAASQAAAAQNSVSPNDRIRVATIGAGGMGTADTNSARSVPGVELVAVCDLYEGRRLRAKEVWGDHIFTTRDYREVLARPDIDAVIVATPDHWHSRVSIDAMNAGKDVYCEKPMVHSLEQGKAVIDAQKRTGRIMQVGSQRVSSIVYQKARELIQAGAIGEPNMIQAWWDRNNELGAFKSSIAPDASPTTIDWDRFVAVTAKRPFDAVRFFQWRGYQDYGTGVAGDLFVHLFSGVHFVIDSMGPNKVYATGGVRFWKDGRDMPDLMLGLYDYPASGRMPPINLALRVNFEDGAAEDSQFQFIGSEGILTIGNGVKVAKHPREREPGYNIETFPKALQEQFLIDYRKKYPLPPLTAASMEADRTEEYLPPHGYSDHYAHHLNFFHAVRTRRPVIEDPVFGFRAAAPALLSNMSWNQGHACNWNPTTMELA